MIFAFRLAPLLFAAIPAAGIGQGNGGSSGNGSFWSRVIAADFATDCESPSAVRSAPNERMRQHLHRLCSCTEERIANTPIRFLENEDSINRKVQAAMKFCSDELGGAPGEGRADRKSRSAH